MGSEVTGGIRNFVCIRMYAITDQGSEIICAIRNCFGYYNITARIVNFTYTFHPLSAKILHGFPEILKFSSSIYPDIPTQTSEISSQSREEKFLFSKQPCIIY